MPTATRAEMGSRAAKGLSDTTGGGPGTVVVVVGRVVVVTGSVVSAPGSVVTVVGVAATVVGVAGAVVGVGGTVVAPRTSAGEVLTRRSEADGSPR